MAIELTPARGLDGMEALGRGLERACAQLALARPLSQWVVAAGLGAWGAAVLAGGHDPRLALEKGLSQVSLRLDFAGAPESGDTLPPGLAAGLFSPPALRVTGERRDGRVFWTALWEV